MLFNSGAFLKFFAAFLLLYYLVRNHLKARNLLIVSASYLFYGWWDYRFLALLAFSSLMDFGIGLGLDRCQKPAKRKLLVTLSIVANLSILGFFKYYGFFVESFMELLAALGFPFDARTLRIVLPAGISFYTFQSLGYTVDVYRRDIRASRHLVHFLAFVSFFPHLVAGPIMRASRLLTQFEQTRRITLAMIQEGIWLGLWGMFKKVVLADNLAPLVEMVYGSEPASGPLVLLGTVAFGFQIYCDFSGYSDIARGAARILGFDLMHNFNLPYAATSVREFWRRWHIGLSTWLRDYLYISLGGNRGGAVRTYLNLFWTMLLGGLWHGAAWNFVFWGAWHGSGLIVHRLWNQRRNAGAGEPNGHEKLNSPAAPPQLSAPQGAREGDVGARVGTHLDSRLGVFLSWILTMSFVLYGWLLFRAGSWTHVASLTRALGHFSWPTWTGSYVVNLAVFTLPLVAMEFWQKRTDNVLVSLTLPTWMQSILQGTLLVAITLFWEREKLPFIYFQF